MMYTTQQKKNVCKKLKAFFVKNDHINISDIAETLNIRHSRLLSYVNDERLPKSITCKKINNFLYRYRQDGDSLIIFRKKKEIGDEYSDNKIDFKTKKMILKWTPIVKQCKERGCNCQGCYYKSFVTFDCNLKEIVFNLFKQGIYPVNDDFFEDSTS